MERLTSLDRIKYLSFSPWEKVPGLCQGVTVRGRESESADFFGRLDGELAARGFRFTARVKQVHGCRVVAVSGNAPVRGALPEADGLAAAGSSGAACAVTVADCVPVFLLDTSSCCLALLHAGWRGTAAGILERAVSGLGELAGVHPDRLEVYLGPSVCGSCYEVGPEVAARFEPQTGGNDSSAVRLAGGKIFLDLRRALFLQARSAGVPAANIYLSRYCTLCHNHLFYSYRLEREHALRRMWAFFGRLAAGEAAH